MPQNKNTSMARSPRKKQKIDNLTKGLLVAFAAIGILLAYFGGKFVFDLVKGWSLTSLPGAPVAATANPNAQTTAVATQSIQTNSVDSVPWDGKSRVNILLIGLDTGTEREITEPGPAKSDTMILVTIDPLSQTIGALSIRRDLWVNIPGFDYNKINMAYFYGDANNLPGGGPQLAMDTVEQLLGVPINYYAQVDFNTFVTLIDEIGGVKIDIKEPILIDIIGGTGPFYLQPGVATLPGNYALAYARVRENAGDDVGRGERQMQVIKAIRDNVLDINTLPRLISRAPALYQEVSGGVKTNMTLNQAIQLASLMMQFPHDNMKTYNMDYTQAEPGTANGLDILVPVPDQIRLLRDEMFANQGSAAAPIVLGNSDPLAMAVQENARIQILNGTMSSGLGDTTAACLKSKGLNIVGTGNTDSTTYTNIIISGSTPYTLKYLTSLMQISDTNIVSHIDANAQVDITLNLGSDWANNSSACQ